MLVNYPERNCSRGCFKMISHSHSHSVENETIRQNCGRINQRSDHLWSSEARGYLLFFSFLFQQQQQQQQLSVLSTLGSWLLAAAHLTWLFLRSLIGKLDPSWKSFGLCECLCLPGWVLALLTVGMRYSFFIILVLALASSARSDTERSFPQ